MELKEQSVPAGILLKIRKLQALAERGVGGEYIEFSQMWEWHRKNYLAERKRMRELFQIAYYDKFKMYASETCDEYEAQRKKKDNDLTFEDILAINMMAAACKNKSFYKQIGEANDDEDDE